MKTTFKILAALAICYCFYACESAKENIDDFLNLAPKAAQFTSALSNSWSYDVLEQHIDSRYLQGNENHYLTTLESSKTLGNMTSCKEINLINLEDQSDIKTKIGTGLCEFEYGKAQLIISFTPLNNEYEVSGFSLKKLN